MKDDADAVMLIGKAIEALSGFYNKGELLQQPEYSVLRFAVCRVLSEDAGAGPPSSTGHTFG